MVFQSVPHGIETVIAGLQNGVPVVNVFNTVIPGTVTATDLSLAATAIASWFQTDVLPALHQSYVMQSVTSTDKSIAGGGQHVINITSGGAGGITTAPAAANAALVISWRTARVGRSYRGRTYIGGLAESMLQDAQHMTTGDAAAFATAGADLLTALTAIGQTLVVVSRWADKVLRTVALVTEIISIIVDTKLDSQRRRTAN